MLDCASVVIPVTFVDKEVDVPIKNYLPVNEFDQNLHDYYEPDKFHQMPVCAQIVCRKFEEEKVLTISSIIKDLLNKI